MTNPVLDEKRLIAQEKLNNPSLMRTIWREIKHDKMALGSLILLTIIVLAAYISPLIIDPASLTRVNFLNVWKPPSAANWLGTDDGGRDVFGQLMVGTRNSLTIGFCVTIIAGIFGLTYGLIRILRRCCRQYYDAYP